MVWDEAGLPTPWSEPGYWEMGLLDERDWQADWITPDLAEDERIMQPCPLLRTEFEISSGLQSARIYATSLSTYELHLDGERVGDTYFTPGWTSYHHRLQYQTYDVTDQLSPVRHALGAILGDGWYRGVQPNGKPDERNFYGDTLALLLQLVIEDEDGRVQVVVSNDSWRAATGPIRHADHYMGELYDARLEKDG